MKPTARKRVLLDTGVLFSILEIPSSVAAGFSPEALAARRIRLDAARRAVTAIFMAEAYEAVVAAPTVVELLYPYGAAEADQAIATLSRYVRILPFDGDCIHAFRELMASMDPDLRLVSAMARRKQGGRDLPKYDLQIVSTAIAYQCDICSDDVDILGMKQLNERWKARVMSTADWEVHISGPQQTLI